MELDYKVLCSVLIKIKQDSIDLTDNESYLYFVNHKLLKR